MPASRSSRQIPPGEWPGVCMTSKTLFPSEIVSPHSPAGWHPRGQACSPLDRSEEAGELALPGQGFLLPRMNKSLPAQLSA
jgi:hypothetical protein